MLNPFTNKTEQKISTRELVKTIIMTPIAIVKMITILGLTVTMLLTLYISSIGYASNDKHLSKISRLFFLINQCFSNVVNRIRTTCCKRQMNTTQYHEMSKLRRCLLWLVQLQARIIMCILGYWWIVEKFPNNKKWMMFPSYLERDNAPKICVANHVAFVDSLYFLSRCVPRSVVMHSGMAKPFKWALNAFSPILVPVTEKQRAKYGSVKDEISQNVGSQILKRPLIIFPEGGTTEANTLIKFQNGAFSDLQTVQPIALKYTYTHFDPSWTNDVSPLWLLFRMCCQFINFLSVDYYDPVGPTNNELSDGQIDVHIDDHMGSTESKTKEVQTKEVQTKEVQTKEVQIEQFKQKVYNLYSADPFFVDTMYSISDSRLVSKLYKTKKVNIDYSCQLLDYGTFGVSLICKNVISRTELEKIMYKFYKASNKNTVLSADQLYTLFNMNPDINIMQLFDTFKSTSTSISFHNIISLLNLSYTNDLAVTSCIIKSCDDLNAYKFLIESIYLS